MKLSIKWVSASMVSETFRISGTTALTSAADTQRVLAVVNAPCPLPFEKAAIREERRSSPQRVPSSRKGAEISSHTTSHSQDRVD